MEFLNEDLVNPKKPVSDPRTIIQFSQDALSSAAVVADLPHPSRLFWPDRNQLRTSPVL
jgi:hypothetical protein